MSCSHSDIRSRTMFCTLQLAQDGLHLQWYLRGASHAGRCFSMILCKRYFCQPKIRFALKKKMQKTQHQDFSFSPIILIVWVFALLYLISPIDVVPNDIPVLGWFDEFALVGWAICLTLNHLLGNKLSWHSALDAFLAFSFFIKIIGLVLMLVISSVALFGALFGAEDEMLQGRVSI
jgi:uncharacterized membrane protein YkvA (DUF1232 family)